MDLGTGFLKSRIARRFCILFILCAFVPTVGLIVLSYGKVVRQLEEQSIIRLQRDAKAYGLSLFDRMIRIDSELQVIGRSAAASQSEMPPILKDSEADWRNLIEGLAILPHEAKTPVSIDNIDWKVIEPFLTPEVLADPNPFILTIPGEGGADVYFGRTIARDGDHGITIVARASRTYLWGIGPEPLLPPMIELTVFDRTGKRIMASENGITGNYRDIRKQQKKPGQDLRVFQFEQKGQTYLASVANLFVESRFQRTGWMIVLSQDRKDVMAATKNFRTTVPFISLLFLLIILYLSVTFIRKGLEPLAQLKEGTQRIARKDFANPIAIKSNDEFQELGDAFNDMAAKLDKQFSTLTVLGEIDRAILSSLDRKKVIHTTLHRLREYFGCDICLYVKNSSAAADHVKVYILQGRRLNDPRIEYFQLEGGEQDVLFADYRHKIMTDDMPLPKFLDQLGSKDLACFLCLTIPVHGEVRRVLVLGWRQAHHLSDDELDQARKIANQLAIAITNALHLENLEKLAMGTIEALARTVDAKSKWTSGHSERVSVIGGRIGKALGLNEKMVDTITRGGLLHDIGKIGIPLAILDKPARLSEQEFEEIKNHPAIGGKILEPITAFQDILPVVVQHHEKFDGSGYPEGLKGEEIDIRARILAVADVWDALVSGRPYREGWVYDRARSFIAEGSGSHFDPLVVNAFLSVVAEED
jgi:HD-GYP domain-containing protein (c-di-GMP phosphodiesterase class II)